MRRLLALLGIALCVSPVARAADGGVSAVDTLAPRRVRLSIASDRTYVSVDSRVSPAALGRTDWSDWDRDGSGAIEGAELGPLRADIERAELAHLSITVDGWVLPVSRFVVRLEAPPGTALGLTDVLDVRAETQRVHALAVGEHRLVVYDQPPLDDGVVPIRISFGRGLTLLDGAGARGEIRGGGARVEVATTKLAPIFWGRFTRIDEGG